MSTQQKIHIKLQHNNEFRRFVIEPESSFNDLKQKISTILNISSLFSIRYLDEESEWITIDSDSELKTGIEISPTLLRLQIVVAQSPSNPVQNSEKPSENIDEPKWKRHRKCRNSEKGSDENNDDCGKWRRKCHKWRNENSEKDSNENDDCGKWKRKRCHKWRQEKSENSLEQNNATSDQPVDGNNDDCPKWKRFRKCRNNENDPTTDDCPKWKRCRKNRNIDNSEPDAKGEMRGWRGRRGFGHGRGHGRWAHMMENSDSDSIEEKTVEEINKEIGSLKEEAKLLMEKKKGIWQEVVGLKEQIKNLRQNDGTKEDIVKLREQIVEKKKACHQYQMQIVFSKNRIWKLKSALAIKADI